MPTDIRNLPGYAELSSQDHLGAQTVLDLETEVTRAMSASEISRDARAELHRLVERWLAARSAEKSSTHVALERIRTQLRPSIFSRTGFADGVSEGAPMVGGFIERQVRTGVDFVGEQSSQNKPLLQRVAVLGVVAVAGYNLLYRPLKWLVGQTTGLRSDSGWRRFGKILGVGTLAAVMLAIMGKIGFNKIEDERKADDKELPPAEEERRIAAIAALAPDQVLQLDAIRGLNMFDRRFNDRLIQSRASSRVQFGIVNEQDTDTTVNPPQTVDTACIQVVTPTNERRRYRVHAELVNNDMTKSENNVGLLGRRAGQQASLRFNGNRVQILLNNGSIQRFVSQTDFLSLINTAADSTSAGSPQMDMAAQSAPNVPVSGTTTPGKMRVQLTPIP
jgi:hypothetical protein